MFDLDEEKTICYGEIVYHLGEPYTFMGLGFETSKKDGKGRWLYRIRKNSNKKIEVRVPRNQIRKISNLELALDEILKDE